MGMLSNNQIPGILPVSCVRTDGGQVVRFRISSLTALMGCWGGAITRQKLLTFLTSFCRAALECRDYLLDPERIVLGWDRVFLDPLTGEARVAYLPVLGAQVQQPTAGAFLRDLLQHTTFALSLIHISSARAFSHFLRPLKFFSVSPSSCRRLISWLIFLMRFSMATSGSL